jgi:hypothetical protein
MNRASRIALGADIFATTYARSSNLDPSDRLEAAVAAALTVATARYPGLSATAEARRDATVHNEVREAREIRQLTPIAQDVARRTGVTVAALMGPSKRREDCRARDELYAEALAAGMTASGVARVLARAHGDVTEGADRWRELGGASVGERSAAGARGAT